MHDRVIVRRGAYYDSVTLMLVSRNAGALEGAEAVAVGMATPLNLELIESQGFDLHGAGELGPNDLLLAVRARDDAAADGVVAAIDAELSARSAGSGGAVEERPPRSIVSAARRHPELSVAFLSVPGHHVAYEAARALDAGLHVFCFSDGVSLEDEAELKRRALELGVLFMGADCGTAIIDGVALGFANAVRRGPVGIVGASGTGIQEVTCLLDAAGVGISHAIGVGGRDLSAQVGGAMTRRGLELLGADAGTEAIVAISKPPDPEVADEIAVVAARAGKPVVLAFLGFGDPPATPPGVEYATTLEAAAARGAELLGHSLPDFEARLPRPPTRGCVRGLYSGGTLCKEAMSIVSGGVGRIASNIPLQPDWLLADIRQTTGHAFIDFGEDELTEGRPHPMIDNTLRIEHLLQDAADTQVTVILLDVVLGYGAHPDPAADLGPAVSEAVAARENLNVIVALCGTDGDPQGLERQRAALLEAGAAVTRSNAHAARMALQAAAVKEASGVRS
ncbi:MAG: acyl-CoA synthetase FdrA [Solirubrobacterales bacterium]|nr:acyl-CoA synthetase FdrA [Solirubrobacterales bacterium]MBV9715024.1 acyl-CoA synthetase FdrA [Solirubrobacterales bacterium]